MTFSCIFRKVPAALSLLLLACGFFLASAAIPAPAVEQVREKEATLSYHFRPIVTFRATFVGATPVIRVRRALTRIDALPPNQMEQQIELTPFTADGTRGFNLRIGEFVLFNVLEGDLDPEEKISLEAAARRTAGEMAAALQAAATQRHPMCS